MLRPILTAVLILFGIVSSEAQAQTAGALISADPVVETPGGMQAWKIAYVTTDEAGQSQQVTGMVVAPREAIPRDPRRIIAWAHGTWGVAERCAPSLSSKFFTATPNLAEMVRRGYVVVAPDYPGLGSPVPHPYLVGIDTARSVLDAVRAARQIPDAAVGDSFVLWGESQGGHAALWTAAEARGYAPELKLIGTAAAAPPTDLVANFRQGSDANVRAMLTAFLAHSWSKRFDAPLSTLFNRTNRRVATRLARNNCIDLEAKPRLGTILGIASVRRALRSKDLGKIAPWSDLARRNSVDPTAVPGTLLIVQGDKDTIVAPAVTRDFARNRCRAGLSLRYISLPGGGHPSSTRDSAAASATFDWIDALFGGAPVPDDCDGL